MWREPGKDQAAALVADWRSLRLLSYDVVRCVMHAWGALKVGEEVDKAAEAQLRGEEWMFFFLRFQLHKTGQMDRCAIRHGKRW